MEEALFSWGSRGSLISGHSSCGNPYHLIRGQELEEGLGARLGRGTTLATLSGHAIAAAMKVLVM